MRLLFTKSNSLMSRIIREVTGEPVSHVVIATVGHVIHSNLLGIRSESEDKFSSEVVFSLPIKPDYERLLKVFAENASAHYDFGAMLYLGLRIWLPWLPKKNLWQSSGMYLCTEWVTRYLDGEEDSMITPYKLYLRITANESELTPNLGD